MEKHLSDTDLLRMSHVSVLTCLALAVFMNQHWVGADHITLDDKSMYVNSPPSQTASKRYTDLDAIVKKARYSLDVLSPANNVNLTDVVINVFHVIAKAEDEVEAESDGVDIVVDDNTGLKRDLQILSDAQGNGMSDVDFNVSQLAGHDEGRTNQKTLRSGRSVDKKMKRHLEILANAKDNGMSNVDFTVTQNSRSGDRSLKHPPVKRSTHLDIVNKKIRDGLAILAGAKGNGMYRVDFNLSQLILYDHNTSSSRKAASVSIPVKRSTYVDRDNKKTKRHLEILSKGKGNGLSDVDFKVSQVSADEEGGANLKPPSLTRAINKRGANKHTKRDLKVLTQSKGDGMSNVTFSVSQTSGPDEKKLSLRRAP